MKKQKVHYMQMLRRRCWCCNRGKLKESRKIKGLYLLGLLFWLGLEKARRDLFGSGGISKRMNGAMHGKRKLLCIPKFQIFCYIEFSQRQSLHIRV